MIFSSGLNKFLTATYCGLAQDDSPRISPQNVLYLVQMKISVCGYAILAALLVSVFFIGDLFDEMSSNTFSLILTFLSILIEDCIKPRIQVLHFLVRRLMF